MQCTERKEVWEARNEDAKDPDCFTADKKGRQKGLCDPQENVGTACVAAARGAGVCLASHSQVLQEEKRNLGWTVATSENSPGKNRLKDQSAGDAGYFLQSPLSFCA